MIAGQNKLILNESLKKEETKNITTSVEDRMSNVVLSVSTIGIVEIKVTTSPDGKRYIPVITKEITQTAEEDMALIPLDDYLMFGNLKIETTVVELAEDEESTEVKVFLHYNCR